MLMISSVRRLVEVVLRQVDQVMLPVGVLDVDLIRLDRYPAITIS